MVKSWGYVAFQGRLPGCTPAHTYSHAPLLCIEVHLSFVMLNGVTYHFLCLARNSGNLFDTAMQKLSGRLKMNT